MGNRASGGMSGLSKQVTFATINLQVVRGLAVDPLDKSQASDSPVTQPSILSPRSYIERLGKIHPLHGHSQAWKLSPRILLTVRGTSGGAGFDVTFSQLGLGYLDLLPSPCARSLGACILRSKIVHWPVPFVPGDSLAPEDLDRREKVSFDSSVQSSSNSSRPGRVRAVSVSNFAAECFQISVEVAGIILAGHASVISNAQKYGTRRNTRSPPLTRNPREYSRKHGTNTVTRPPPGNNYG